MEIVINHFNCKREKLMIRGLEFKPNNTNLPIIVSSHGFESNYLNNIPMCIELAKLGYAVYCFDFCGGGIDSTSDGSSLDMNIFTEVDDLICVIDYVKSLKYTNKNNIILLGTSQGGLVSAMVAAKYKQEISKLILKCPALVIPNDARLGKLGGSCYDPLNVPDVIHCDKIDIGKQFHESVKDLDVYELIKGYTGQVLYIQGKDDKVVPYSYAIKAKDEIYNDNCKLILLDNEGHTFSEKGNKLILKHIKDFLKCKSENNINDEYEKGYKEFCSNELKITDKLYEEWDINGVYTECTGEYSIILKVNDTSKIYSVIKEKLENNPFIKANEVGKYFSDILKNIIENDFYEYCFSDNYYPPVCEDYYDNLESIVDDFCKNYGFKIVDIDYNGETSDYIPRIEYSRYYR